MTDAQSTSQIPNLQSSIVNRKSTCASPTNPPETPAATQTPVASQKPRRIHPVLSRLTPDEKQKLIYLYEQHEAKDASRLAAEKLNIQISSATLSRLYSTWRIKEDEETRNDLEAANNASIESLTEKQLQLRLLELASRPNMDHTELRAICHSFARLQSVKLSERRVQLAEAKEARLTASSEALKPFTDEEYERSICALMGKDPDPEDQYYDDNQQIASENTTEVGPVAPRGPRPDEALSINQEPSSAPLATSNQSKIVNFQSSIVNDLAPAQPPNPPVIHSL